MKDATPVSAGFRIVRDDGGRTFTAAGQLHRLLHGWALTCRTAAGTGESADAASDILLVLRADEIRLTRKGPVQQEQWFRVGEWKRGTIGTPFGSIRAEAFTSRIEMDLLPTGGRVAWEYDWKTAVSETERCTITLEIREEPAK